MRALLLLLLVPPAVVLLNLAEIIPYVGPIFQVLWPILAFFIFIGIGWYAGEKAQGFTRGSRILLFAYTLIICTFTFAGPFMAGYYTYPVKAARMVSAEKHMDLTYEQASVSMKALLRQETGSDGVIGYGIYNERLQLSSRSLGAYASSEMDGVDDLTQLPGALINIILHAVPLTLKWALCDQLGWVGDAGLVGLAFWYLFSVALSSVPYWLQWL